MLAHMAGLKDYLRETVRPTDTLMQGLLQHAEACERELDALVRKTEGWGLGDQIELATGEVAMAKSYCAGEGMGLAKVVPLRLKKDGTLGASMRPRALGFGVKKI